MLLKNENNLLPLKKDIRSIAVIGPNADDDLNQLGDYTTTRPVSQDIVTVLEGIKSKVSSKTKVTYVKGCDVMGNELNEIAKAKKQREMQILQLWLLARMNDTHLRGNKRRAQGYCSSRSNRTSGRSCQGSI